MSRASTLARRSPVNKQTNKRTARRHVRTHGTEHANRRKRTHTTHEQGGGHTSPQTEGQE